MRVGVLGTGMVGRALATKLVELGHEVCMGSRNTGNEKAVAWATEAGDRASHGTFADAAAFGELIINCTLGMASLHALSVAGADAIGDKVLIDVANPLDSSGGMPPSLGICNTDSLGEQIQRAYPAARVVKALNTINCSVMVDPTIIPGEHVTLICGNDEAAKADVAALLGSFGWPRERVLDLGDISASRATEMYMPLWLRLYGVFRSPNVNIQIQHA